MNIFDKVEGFIFHFYTNSTEELLEIKLSPWDTQDFLTDSRVVGNIPNLKLLEERKPQNPNLIMIWRGVDITVDDSIMHKDVRFVTRPRHLSQ